MARPKKANNPGGGEPQITHSEQTGGGVATAPAGTAPQQTGQGKTRQVLQRQTPRGGNNGVVDRQHELTGTQRLAMSRLAIDVFRQASADDALCQRLALKPEQWYQLGEYMSQQ